MKKKILFIVSLLLYLICILMSSKAKAQNIGINSTGATPNSAAMLDIDVSALAAKKGLLIPRMTAAQKTAMNPLPAAAQGLIIYQTDGVQGFYYNSSTTTTPSWNYIPPSGSSSGWLLGGNLGTSSVTDFIGTMDGQDVVFKAGGTELMRLSATGQSLGVGANPGTLTRMLVETNVHQSSLNIKTSVNGSPNAYALLIDDNSDNGSNSYAARANITGNPANSYGFDVNMQNNASKRYAFNATIQGNASTSSRGVVINDNTSANDKIGFQFITQGNAWTSKGVEIDDEAANANTRIGVHTILGGTSSTSYGFMVDDNVTSMTKYGMKTTLTGAATNTSYGLDITNQTTGNYKYGINTTLSGQINNDAIGLGITDNSLAMNKYGIQATMGGGVMANSTGLEINQNTSALNTLRGIKISVPSGSNGNVYGIDIADASNGLNKYGANIILSGGSSGSVYGMNIENTATASTTYGLKVKNAPAGFGGGNEYAIYAESGNLNNWAGYFLGKGYFSNMVGINTNNPTEMLEVNGKVKIGNYVLPATDGSSYQVLQTNGGGTVSWANPALGTVTSVDLNMPSMFTVSNAPVTSNGIISVDLTTQTANKVFAGPATGAAAQPDFRTLVSADIPDLSGSYVKNQTVTANFTTGQTANYDVTGNAEVGGTLNVNGNVGIGTLTPGAKLEVTGQVKITGGTPGAGKVLTSDATGLASWQTPAASGSGWSLTGNAGTVSGTNFIGTTDAQDFIVKTNNTENVRVTSAGNVGIGTSSPSSKLYVADLAVPNGIRRQAINATIFSLPPAANDTVTGIKSYGTNGNSNASSWSLGLDATGATNGSGTGYAVGIRGNAFYGMSTTGVMANAQGTAGVYGVSSIARGTASGSNVYGAYADVAGTTSSNIYGYYSRMMVTSPPVGTAYGTNNLVATPSTTSYGIRTDVSNASTNYGGYFSSVSAGAVNYGVYAVASGGTSNWAGYFSGDEYVSGNVGIGTTSPGTKLEVAGKVKAQQLQITTGAASNYVLTSDASGNATWQALSTPTTGWNLTGNAGTTAGTNFIGTTDNVDVVIKRGGDEGVRYTAGGAMLASGNTTTGVTPASGAGRRMMWIPAKSAFRAGEISGTEWDDANIGNKSIAMGPDTKASGYASVAIGEHNWATGGNASAFGWNSISSGTLSFALGLGTTASNTNTLAIGAYSQATGNGSIAIGNTALSSADTSLAIGSNVTASGTRSLALGSNVSTAGFKGSLIAGDYSTFTVSSSTSANQYKARFAGGYIFHTDAAQATANTIVFNSGNVGVGTLTPVNKLDVEGGIAIGATYSGTNTAPANGAIVEGSVGIGGTATPARLSVVGVAASPAIPGASSNGVARFGISSSEGLDIGKMSTSPYSAWMQSGFNGSTADPLAIQPQGGNVGIGLINPSAVLDINGTAKIGTLGSVLTNIIKSTNTVDVGSVAANSSLAVSYTITNAAVGSTVSVSPASALTNGLVIAYARVSAANTIEIKFTNVTGAAIDPPSMDYYITVIK